MLRMLNSKPKLSWCCFGDFNEFWRLRKKEVVHNGLIISCNLSETSLMNVALSIWGTSDLSSLGMVVGVVNGFGSA